MENYMGKKGKEYEIKVNQILQFFTGSEIQHDVKIIGKHSGKLRQIDNLIYIDFLGNKLLGEIECKDWNKKIGIPHLEAFSKKKDDIGANFGILFGKSGFTESVLEYAEKEGIWLFQLLEDGIVQENQLKFAVGVSVAYCNSSSVNVLGFDEAEIKSILNQNKTIISPNGEEYNYGEFIGSLWDKHYSDFVEFKAYTYVASGSKIVASNGIESYQMEITLHVTMLYYFKEVPYSGLIQFKSSGSIIQNKIKINHNIEIFEKEWIKLLNEEMLLDKMNKSANQLLVRYHYQLETYI